ncbi:MAG: histidinol dehydrogenase [Muribaculaceae bacterium]|nr:histidinol dehydrogenase [Muribaculaceae bacterium]
MNIIVNPPKTDWPEICRRNIPDDTVIEESVAGILNEVKHRGDAALKHFAREFDGVENLAIKVTRQEIEEACSLVSEEVKRAISIASENIEKFHKAQLPKEIKVEVQPGVTCYQKGVAIKRVGLYIPGGRAPLFSTVLMLGLPARIAGCNEVVLCTPRGKNGRISPEILYAASVCGISEIYGVGGAQAIGALAYGTESIRPVNKIFGPGNRYVTKAKMKVSDKVAIDMPAGPSEVLVMADETANPLFVAADLLSQAEHGPDSQAILVTTDKRIAERVEAEVKELKKHLSRTDSIEKSLSKSHAIVFDSIDTCVEFIDTYGPEHLIISAKNPWKIAGEVSVAGSVFIGNFSPESAGDYASGTNHTLPTSGWAASYSGVNIDSFIHKITYQELTPQGLENLGDTITSMAKAEGLDAHALAVEVRLQERRVGK